MKYIDHLSKTIFVSITNKYVELKEFETVAYNDLNIVSLST